MASRPHKTAAKRYYTIARLVVKDLLVVFVAGKNENGKVQVWNRKRQRIEPISATTASAIADVPHKWVQHCVVTGRRQDGQQYAKLEIMAPQHPVTQSQIAASCNELHNGMVAKFNGMHRLTAAWVASPSGIELDDQELD
ncbi:MAG: hypothetical protein ACRC3K_07525, partial [Plesiomonas sp.]